MASSVHPQRYGVFVAGVAGVRPYIDVARLGARAKARRLVGLRKGWRRACGETVLGLLGFLKVVVLG
ncbi:hypothetical protein ES288_D02G124900v1 [Gossypium darwinii]|uniref:Uncharacterized protein n=1 Tax=Gossypium darwinii TaxID=34276 RepID=A0A5D2DC87_GOSDA|nr:hypothetical protein ES288_D02G124900v1 [Gossypium darwinii]